MFRFVSMQPSSGWAFKNVTFMLPCNVIDFFLNNQPDALIIPILFCYKTLHVSGIFSAHHQELSTVHSALVSFMQVSDDGLPSRVRMELQFHPDSAGKWSSEKKKLHDTYQCRMYSRTVFLNRRAAARYRTLAPIIPGRERFSWNLSF